MYIHKHQLQQGCALNPSIQKQLVNNIVDMIVAGIEAESSHITKYLSRCRRVLDETIISTTFLGSCKPHNRDYLCQQLGELGSQHKSIIRSLLNAMNDENELVQISAIQSLGEIGYADSSVITALILALNNSTQKVHAATAMGRLRSQDSSVIQSLLSALEEEGGDNQRFRFVIIETLGELAVASQEVIASLIHSLCNSQYTAAVARTLRKLDSSNVQLIPALITILNDDDLSLRVCAARELGAIINGNKFAVDALIACISRDISPWVRNTACKSLGQLGRINHLAIEGLKVSLEDTDLSVRAYAAMSLQELNCADLKVKQILISALSHNDHRVKCEAIRTVKYLAFNDDSIVIALISTLNDPDRATRDIAYTVLKQVCSDHKSVFDVVLATLTRVQSNPSKRIVKLLGDVGYWDQALVNILVSITNEVTSDCRAAAALALGKLGNPQKSVLDALQSTLRDIDTQLCVNAAESLMAFGAHDRIIVDVLSAAVTCTETEYKLRIKAAMLLGRLEDADATAIDVCVSLLGDGALKSTIIQVLSQSRDNRATLSLLSELPHASNNEKRYIAQALGQTPQSNQSVFDSLISLLTHDDFEVRYHAAISFVAVGNAHYWKLDTRRFCANCFSKELDSSWNPRTIVKAFLATENRVFLTRFPQRCLLNGVAIVIQDEQVTVYDDEVIQCSRSSTTRLSELLQLISKHPRGSYLHVKFSSS